MRHLVSRLLKYPRRNKIKTLVGVVVVPTVAVYTYNAKINPYVFSTGVLRTGRAGIAVVSAAINYKYQLWGSDTTSEAYEQHVSDVHKQTAKILCDMCSVNGGLYIKIGQHIGALELLLPKEYTHTFKVLHHEAPQSTLDSVKGVIRAELGKEVEELFSEFDPVPLGSASLAQVHRAVLKQSGREVAVKVQHSMVQIHSKGDTIVIQTLASCIDTLFPEFQFDWLIDAIKRNLPKELDFVQEGQNAEHLSMLFTDIDFLKVPKIYWDHTNRRVLTMEYCRGGKVNDIQYMRKHGIDENVVLSHLSKIFSQMIFMRGYIHCDPHPGNVLVQKTGNKTQIVLLDHGLYQTLTDEFRVTYCKLWQALLKGDKEMIKKQSYKLGVGKYYGLFACMVANRTWDHITNVGVADRTVSIDVERFQEAAVNQIPEISQVLNFVPRQLVLLLKTNDLLRGIEITLLQRNTQGVLTFLNMARYCMTALVTHKLNKSDSMYKSAKIYYNYWLCLTRLKIYKALYWLSLTRFGQGCNMLLPSNVSI